MNNYVPLIALTISLCSLIISFWMWLRSFRPIVTVAVKTHTAGNVAILYNLVVMNSGSLPARNIRIQLADDSLVAAFGDGASAECKEQWLACFAETIPILQNNDRVFCSFGTTTANDAGFWKYGAMLRITVRYDGWFGWRYK